MNRTKRFFFTTNKVVSIISFLIVGALLFSFTSLAAAALQLIHTSPISLPEAWGGPAQTRVVSKSTGASWESAGAHLPISYDLSSLAGNEHYVAPNGSDTNGNGSDDKPFATVSKAYSV